MLVLYSRLSGYTIACLRALRRETGADLAVFARLPDVNAPFSPETIGSLGTIRQREMETQESLLAAAGDFCPDAVLVSGWRDRGYAAVCRRLKRSGVPVVSGCDNQWAGTLRQRAAILSAPWHIHRFIDVLWVPGERQRVFANALGYRGSRCWEGFYACDVDLFASSAAPERSGVPASSPAFLYVGRYVAEKGIDVLAAAYDAYRSRVASPWKLVCAGSGPLRDRLVACGAEDRGFVQPTALPALMQEGSAFILPSGFEPWGVVLHEAAAAGLPLIASRACGASVHLLRSGYNGFSFERDDVDGLTHALLAMHHADETVRGDMGRASASLARQFTPELWAATLTRGVETLRRESSHDRR